MCYNCGCGMSNDPMGQGNAGKEPNGKAITDETFKVAAEAFGMTEKEAKENTLKLLQVELKK